MDLKELSDFLGLSPTTGTRELNVKETLVCRIREYRAPILSNPNLAVAGITGSPSDGSSQKKHYA